jgi:hypothetical protein
MSIWIFITTAHYSIYCNQGPSWSWSYGSWIYNYLCNQCLSPLTLWVRSQFMRAVQETTLCDKVCQWLATGRWFSPGTPVSSTNKTDSHDISEILLKVTLHSINWKPLYPVIIVFNTKKSNGSFPCVSISYSKHLFPDLFS